MNAIEIISRPTGSTINLDEQLSVIEWYVKQRKAVDIKMRIPQVQDYPQNLIGRIIATQELTAINEAFSIACNWYSQNKDKIK